MTDLQYRLQTVQIQIALTHFRIKRWERILSMLESMIKNYETNE